MVGGPINLLLLTAAAGAAIYKGSEIAVKQCAKAIKAHNANETAAEDILYATVIANKSNEGLEFAEGDQFRVLEADGDSVLIEKLGDNNNPYFVSKELLHRISTLKE